MSVVQSYMERLYAITLCTKKVRIKYNGVVSNHALL